MITLKRLLPIFLPLVALYVLFLPAAASAHINGKAVVNLNGLDVVPSSNPYSINDQGPELYEPHQAMTFAINKRALPASVPADSEFKWTWGDSTTPHIGLHGRHRYAKAGTYIVQVEFRAPGQSDFARLDTVEVALKQPPRTMANMLILGGSIAVVLVVMGGIRLLHKRRSSVVVLKHKRSKGKG
ncbi:MAG TPA: hypothetical protein VLF43_00475 [Candidatus Saccharimonadales bacterium]|nr:hypothetical protein [Candidatus Saccharimonadales bacterium]